ncbi:MAG: DUF1214 domain-containing protein [Solirubrobacterales bacterium]|nr:DUF1214 domain-containing protein [Solirubrobacterales bacterium]
MGVLELLELVLTARRAWARALLAGLLAGAVGLLLLARVAGAQPPRSGQAPAASSAAPYSIALNYTIRFYPRLFTYVQTNLGKQNFLNGPQHMGPVYGAVPAPNDDTLYANFFLNLAQGPRVFTIPGTNVNQVRYSLLVMDVFGHVIQTNIPTNISTTGTYLLVSKGWHGTPPPGATVIRVPYPLTVWVIRADKYVNGQNLIPKANSFRTSLRLASLQNYEQDPSTGATQLLPLRDYAPRAKAIADQLVDSHTTTFFRLVQLGVSSPTTAPLSPSDVQLSRAFNRVFAAANQAARHGNNRPLSVLIKAARAAHALIIHRFVSNVDQNRWVYFDNIGEWGTNYLDRAATTEFLEFSNSATTSGYYSAFTDDRGVPLNGSRHVYRLTFSADANATEGAVPEAQRFWSITAYLPRGMTLVPNAARKYLVASYTNLKKNSNGTITVYIQAKRPAGHTANWLPVPRGSFALVLRVYGPTGNTSPGSKYIPPKITASSGG